MIMQIFEDVWIFFGFLYYHFSRKKHKIKNKVRIKTTFLLMMKILKVKSPTQVHFRLGQNERIFFEKPKATNEHHLNKKQRKERQQRPNYN
jgi:hypothetical protein